MARAIWAHADGGVQIRPVGYDKPILMRELFIDLPADDAIAARFYERLKKHLCVGWDYVSAGSQEALFPRHRAIGRHLI